MVVCPVFSIIIIIIIIIVLFSLILYCFHYLEQWLYAGPELHPLQEKS